MIHEVLVLVKDLLNAHLRMGQNPNESQEDRVVFLDGQSLDPLTFKLGAVSILLINVQEEHTLRAPDLYNRVLPDGTRQKTNPEIRLNLYILLVAHFKQYEESLRAISQIIRYFQRNRTIDTHMAPGLSEDIDTLTFELMTQSFSEQNEIWSALRVTQRPSVLYRAKMVIFRDDETVGAPQVGAVQLASAAMRQT